jgi:hypothetical protein
MECELKAAQVSARNREAKTAECSRSRRGWMVVGKAGIERGREKDMNKCRALTRTKENLRAVIEARLQESRRGRGKESSRRGGEPAGRDR